MRLNSNCNSNFVPIAAALPLTSWLVHQECHCMLFLTEDNDFRGEDNQITLDEVVEATKGLSGVQG